MISVESILLMRGNVILVECLPNNKGYIVPESIRALYQLPPTITNDDFELCKTAQIKIASYEYLIT